MLFQKIFVDVYGPSEHSFQLSNLLLTISLVDFQLFEWLGPIGMCNFSSLIYCLYFTGVLLVLLHLYVEHFLQHQIHIINIQYKVPDNLALLPVVTDVITGKANVNLLAALFTTM